MKRFKEINDLFEATGFTGRTNLSSFYVLRFEDIPNESATYMPPYQKDFYQVALILQPGKAWIEIDDQSNKSLENTLYFLSPKHYFSWQRSLNTTGYILYFKPDFLNFYRGDLPVDFSFFDLAQSNSLKLSETELGQVTEPFEKLLTEYQTPHLYREQILQSFLLSFLFKLKGINETRLSTRKQSPNEAFAQQYINLVNNCYIEFKQVNDYAQKLNVSSSYLHHLIKTTTGKSAKTIIVDKIIKEAKNQLKYSDLNIAQIAHNLGYDEPTHFTRLFKQRTQQSPNDYRQNNG